MATDPYIETNRRNWDERASIHARSKMYGLDAVRGGKSSLLPLEREALGDVRNKNLLHLHCHIGTDTVSWARLGAHVTGLDLSGASLAVARQLARDCKVEANFIEANVYDAPENLTEAFDIVIATYGVTCWVPDMARFARVAARCMRPGATFLLIDSHPVSWMVKPEGNGTLRPARSYFREDTPEYYAASGSYADANAILTTPNYEWSHDLGEIVTAVCAAGLRIESLAEYPYSYWRCFQQGMAQDATGWWRLAEDKIPLMFALRATKPE